MLDVIRQDTVDFISEVPMERAKDFEEIPDNLLRFETPRYKIDFSGNLTLSMALYHSSNIKRMILPNLLDVQAKADIIWMQPYVVPSIGGFKVWITGVLRPR